ncbi:MAG: hypothetical protein Q4E75_05085 [bacterium]|nr:hypothetical protein [bacterium]
MDKQKKQSILFRDLDLAFVYIFIALVGIAIVLGMVSYLNSKVKEFTDFAFIQDVEK